MTMMELIVNRNLVKAAAGRLMFCPVCHHVMDAKRTVLVTVGENATACCAKCWDGDLRGQIERKGRLAECSVLDGRELWKRNAAQGLI